MSGIFLRWGVPGFVTVVGGTAISIMMTGENVASDLTSRASDALANAEFGWASVSFEGRDAVISGTANSQQMINAALARIAAVHGVRAVSSNIVLAEFVSPFPFEARIDGAGIALSGGVPDETAHAEIALRASAATDTLRLMSGAPDKGTWRAAVDYGLSHLEQFDEGEVRLADLQLSIAGRARSPEAYDILTELGRAGAPQGVQVAALEIAPPLAAPFEWRANFDGDLVTVSGYTPTEEFAQRLQAADLGVPVSTSLVLASGAPPEFDRNALLLFENLVRLEQGTATISDGNVSLVGAPADQDTAEAVKLAMTPAGATLTLDPPRVGEYEFTARKSDGVVALDGFVPDAATRDRLDAFDNVDAAGLELARGAPERFNSAVDFVLDALAHLSEGSAQIRGSVISLEGRATTVADFTALETTIALGAPQGLILRQAEILPPLADPFVWSAEKDSDGKIAIAGFVPSQSARQILRAAAPNLGTDTSTLADGPPADFERVAAAALSVLPLLDTGKVSFDGELWNLSGVVDTPQEGFAAEAAFAAAGLGGSNWTYAVTLPGAEAAAETTLSPPVVMAAPEPEPEPEPAATNEPAPEPLAEVAADVEATMPEPAEADRAVETAQPEQNELEVAALPEEPANPAPVVRNFIFEASKALGAPLVLKGQVPADAAKRWFGLIAGEVPTDALQIGGQLPPDFIPNADAGVRALAMLSDGQVGLDGDKWVLTGRAASDEERSAALASLDALPSSEAWEINVTQLPPVEICRQKVTAFATRNAILFQSGSAKMTDESAPALDELAGYLSACPEAAVHVEGHTDADGEDDLNLVLSVARAEAVVNALIARGVRSERLYAVGYGESLPIADNETKAGKQANRRISFTVLDEPQ